MERFYLTQNGKPVGPWALNEIIKNLKSNGLAWTDYLYDEAKQDWVLLMDHPALLSHFRETGGVSAKGATPSPKNPQSKGKPEELSNDKEWFVLKDENKYGPFTFVDLVKMLQDKNLYEFDYIWNSGFTNWKRVSECEEFRPEKVRALRGSGHPEIEEVFFRRRHARARYGASLVVHNNQKVWKGESLEISPGGCGLFIENSLLEPGQTLFLHFKAGDGVPPFNAICQIVSKQMSTNGSAQVKYGVKFTSISRQVQLAIKGYTDNAA